VQPPAQAVSEFSQTRVLDGADWVNDHAMICSRRNKGAAEKREGRFMTTLSQRHLIRLLVLGMLSILPATSGAQQQRPPILQKLSRIYGLDSFGQIEAIRYTFNLHAPGQNVSRSWTWEPKTDQVTYEGKDKSGNLVKVTYLRSQLGRQPANVRDNIDPDFINDNYWLLFPFHLSRDTSAAVEDAGAQKLPQGNGSAEKLVVRYPSNGGYSPGDTWELYVGSDGRVEELAYHRGGPPSTRSLWPGPTTRRQDRCSSYWIIAERETAIRCGRQAGGVKHLDGSAVSGEFSQRGSRSERDHIRARSSRIRTGSRSACAG
jgi:hypothetical protein